MGASTGATSALDTTSFAPTVEIVWPFRLLKISLVAVVLILLLTTVTREPGEPTLPIPPFLKAAVQQAIDRVTDDLL